MEFDLNTINVGVEFERNDELNGKVKSMNFFTRSIFLICRKRKSIH